MAKLEILDYPIGIGTEAGNGKHYMLMTSYESKNALHSNESTALSSIALYIPPNALKTSFNANYGDMEGGARRARMATGAKGAVTNFEWWNDEGGTIGSILTGIGMAATNKMAQGLDKATGILSAGTGLAVNNHMALVYKGPSQFRTHEFAFSFFPKNKDDADRIQEILKDFQDGMLPRMWGTQESGTGENTDSVSDKLSAPFFQSPRHWKIDFFMGGNEKRENKYLFKINKSVITDMTVNHDQQSMVSLHPDGSPVQTTLNLTFKEIEFLISGDKTSSETQAARDLATNRMKPVTTARRPGTPGPLLVP